MLEYIGRHLLTLVGQHTAQCDHHGLLHAFRSRCNTIHKLAGELLDSDDKLCQVCERLGTESANLVGGVVRRASGR